MTPTTPLTKDEIEDAQRELAFASSGRHSSAVCALAARVTPRALSDLKRLRELLERAPEHCQDLILETCKGKELHDYCDACAWNAERKRALGVGEK